MLKKLNRTFLYLLTSISLMILMNTMPFTKEFSKDQDSKTFHLNEIDNSKLRFVRIPAGKILLGDIRGQKDERPRVSVTLSEFYMQDTEVTKELFQWYINKTGINIKAGCQIFKKQWVFSKRASWVNPGYRQDIDHPVVCVSWEAATDFSNWLSKNLPGRFRLPTEAEWEYAARAGSTYRYYWGKNPMGLCTHSNASDRQTLKRFPTFKSNDCDDGYVETAPVKQFKPNPNGLYDIYGNVWEWVQDCWSPHYHHIPLDGSASESGDCNRRGFRGGAWGDNPNFARSGLRNRTNKEIGKDDVGFRLVWSSKK